MRTGQTIADRYKLSSLIGRGGMAEVWSAADKRLERDVAVKFLAPRLADDPEFLVRFFAEAQAVARIPHPGVVAVLDFGHEGDTPYLVMEYVGGGSLNDLPDEKLTVERAIEMVAQAARGAGAAHQAGVIHRDIKPANILLDESSNAKLADFGISAYKAAERFTATGTAIGSPYYISPEQVSGAQATSASDVYSLGVVAYELLTGVRPFEADNVTAVAIAHVDEQPQPPSAHRADLEPWVDELVLRCLAKDPEERFRDGDALAVALGAAALPEVSSDVAAMAFFDEDPVTPERRSGLVPTAVVVTLLLLAAAGLFASTGDTQGEGVANAVEDSRPNGRPSATASPSPTSPAGAPATGISPEPSASPDGDDREKERSSKKDSSSETETEESEPEPTPTPEASASIEPSPTPTSEGQKTATEEADESGN